MTYLQLINAVLTRLREDTIDDIAVLDTNPFYRYIGSAVNDAKDRVEDAWQWGALRTTDAIELGEVTTTPDLADKADAVYEIPGTEPERHFILRGAWFQKIDPSYRPTKPSDPANLGAINGTTIYPARQLTIDGWIQRRMNQDKIPEGQPSEFSIIATNPLTGNLNVAVNVVPELDDLGEPVWQLVLYSVRHQDTLVDGDTRLLVPSLPVYTLATALASRERGEVGGTPVSELFAIADSHLSDAIAQDSALYQYDTDWTAGYRWNRTNFRTA